MAVNLCAKVAQSMSIFPDPEPNPRQLRIATATAYTVSTDLARRMPQQEASVIKLSGMTCN